MGLYIRHTLCYKVHSLKERNSEVLEILTALSGQEKSTNRDFAALEGKHHKNFIAGNFQQQPCIL